MYADPGAAGGVLEPEGIVEIKYRSPDLIATMHRLDPRIHQLKVLPYQHFRRRCCCGCCCCF